MTFESEDEFLAWLKEQPEKYYTYAFLPNSSYPLNLQVERKPDMLIIQEFGKWKA